MPEPERTDVYARITEAIVAAIEAGAAGEFHMPWHHDGTGVTRPANVQSGKAYRGVNVLALWVAACVAGYPTGRWGTYRQWRAVGAQVRKGERGSLVVFWNGAGAARPRAGEECEPEEGGEVEPKGSDERRFFARGYVVFNAAQVDGDAPPALPRLPEAERHARAEQFLDALGITTAYGAACAFYRPDTDTVHLPAFEAFKDAASAYSVRKYMPELLPLVSFRSAL